MGVLVPRAYAAEELNRMQEERVDTVIAEAEHWNRELKRIDEGLSLVWIGEEPFPGQVAERFHIVKRVPDGLDAYIPLTGPNGEFREPGAWMLDALAQADMWNERVRNERARNLEKIEEAKRRDEARLEEQVEDEMRLAARAARRVKGDGGMHKRTDGKRKSLPAGTKLILPPGASA